MTNHRIAPADCRGGDSVEIDGGGPKTCGAARDKLFLAALHGSAETFPGCPGQVIFTDATVMLLSRLGSRVSDPVTAISETVFLVAPALTVTV